ncbi:MAG: serine/threonine-protein kinase, partial [Planctomycetota bacterium]
MSIPLKHCPAEQTLSDYVMGKLEEPEHGQTETHVLECDACEDTLRGLSASDTLNRLTDDCFRAGNQQARDDDEFLDGLITRLKVADDIPASSKQGLEKRALEVTRSLAPPESDEYIASLGQYDIVELIGAGSTGVVFKADDRQLERTVALKILRPSLGDAAKQRFLVEARAAAAITHPNVVAIHHVGTEDDLAYIVMQWIPGRTLEQWLSEVTFIPEVELRRVAVQIASGLKAAHAKNLIHRDIKPANIWIDDEHTSAIILDFGLARIADDDPHMTATGMLAGTPNFMSPEQTRGLELDGRSDLFSLGCLMYRAATGKLPFGSNSVLATLQTIQNETPRQPVALNPALSNDFSDLVMCLLEKQPGNRPANAEQTIAALQQSREQWPFVAVSGKSAPMGQLHTQVPSHKKLNPAEFWIVTAIIGFVMLAAGFIYQDDIIRIATNHGELVIQCDDEDVEVEIKQNGEVIRVIDLKTEQSIDIVAGEYNIEVTQPENGFQISQDSVVMTRGRKQIVSITRDTESNEGGSTHGMLSDHHEDSPFVIPGYTPPRTEFPKTPENQSAREAMLDARRAIAHGDVAAARKFVEVAEEFNVDYARLNDSPDEITALINRHDEIVELAQQQSPEYNREAVEFLVIQANGILKYDDLQTATLLRTAAGEFPTASYEEKILELQEQIERYQGMYTNEHPLLLSTQNQLATLVAWRGELENQGGASNPAAGSDESHSGDLTIEDIPTLDLSNLYTATTEEVERLAGEATTNVARLKRLQIQYQFQDFFGVVPQYVEQAQAQLRTVEDELARRYARENEATYEGRTFSQWIKDLQYERSVRAQVQICAALGALAKDDERLQSEMIDEIRSLIREHGSVVRYGLPAQETDIGYRPEHLNDGFILAFQHVNETNLIEFIKEEFSHGTKQSREFVLLLFAGGALFENDADRQEQHRQIIADNAEELLDALNDSFEVDDGFNDFYPAFLQSVVSSCYRGNSIHQWDDYFEADQKLRNTHPGVVQRLIICFQTGNHTEKVNAAKILSALVPETDGLAEYLASTFLDPAAALEEKVDCYIAMLLMDSSFVGPAFKQLADPDRVVEPDTELEKRLEWAFPMLGMSSVGRPEFEDRIRSKPSSLGIFSRDSFFQRLFW